MATERVAFASFSGSTAADGRLFGFDDDGSDGSWDEDALLGGMELYAVAEEGGSISSTRTDGQSPSMELERGGSFALGSLQTPLLASATRKLAARSKPRPASRCTGALTNLAFLFIGMGVAMPWTALRGGITYFNSFGGGADAAAAVGTSFTFTAMQVAYNVPALPLLLIQTLYDAKQDKRFGARRAFTVRLAVSFSLLLAALGTVPFITSKPLLYAIAGIVGVCDAAAYGSSAQLFALFSARNGAFYFLGSSLTSLITIGLTFATGFSAQPPPQSSVNAMYFASAAIVALGLIASLLLLSSKLGRRTLARKDLACGRPVEASSLPTPLLSGEDDGMEAASSSEDEAADRAKGLLITAKPMSRSVSAERPGSAPTSASGLWKGGSPRLGAAAALHSNSSLGSTLGGGPTSNSSIKQTLSNSRILRMTAYAQAAIVLCWLSTNVVDPLITYVPSQADTPNSRSSSFRLIVLYASLLGELSGKQLTICKRRPFKSAKLLFFCILARLVLGLTPFLLYVMQPFYTSDARFHVRVDGAYIAFQAVFDAAGAFFSSSTYAMVGNLVPEDPTARTQASSLLSIALTIGVYLGLGGSVGLASLLSSQSPAALAAPGS